MTGQQKTGEGLEREREERGKRREEREERGKRREEKDIATSMCSRK